MTECRIVDVNGVKCVKRAISYGLCGTHNERKKRGKDLYAPVRARIVTDDLGERLRFYAPPGDPDGCWDWTGALNKGYGVISIAGSKVRGAHIVAWEVANNRKLPEGMVIRHTCDNPPCVNPRHLLLGRHADNVADKVERGRHGFGETHSQAKLTDEMVLEICRLYDEGRSQNALAEQFGILQSHVSLIVRGELWGHVTGRTPPERPRHHKMTQEKADLMREMRDSGGWTRAALAEKFSVSMATVHNVLSGKCWAKSG